MALTRIPVLLRWTIKISDYTDKFQSESADRIQPIEIIKPIIQTILTKTIRLSTKVQSIDLTNVNALKHSKSKLITILAL